MSLTSMTDLSHKTLEAVAEVNTFSIGVLGVLWVGSQAQIREAIVFRVMIDMVNQGTSRVSPSTKFPSDSVTHITLTIDT
jgi:hypothetical protein